MTKFCKIVRKIPSLNIVAFIYDGKEIQFTGKHIEYDGHVYVDFSNGKYFIVEKPTLPAVKKETKTKIKEIPENLETAE